MTDAVLVEGLTKSFGSKQVLRGVELTVRAGELVGLVGQNGAGKTTMLRTLVGLSRRDGGTVSVLGLDPARDPVAIRRRACYLPGETSVYTQMTGQQFLDFALSFYPRHRADVLRDLADLFALPLQQKVRGYSAGMKQKLAILATLAPEAELYVLDEPDRALDASVRFQLRDVLQRLHRQGCTLLLSSHHLSEVESLADRLEFLMQGRIVDQQRVAAARARLMRRLRLRLRPGTALPDGDSVQELPRDAAEAADGAFVLETRGDPVRWLGRLPEGSVLAAELGVARLEDLYKLLLAEQGFPAGTGEAAGTGDATGTGGEA